MADKYLAFLTGDIAPGCDLCDDGEGYSCMPMYGVAPHDCYWRKGPQFTIGQSTLLPLREDDCSVPDLEEDEDWNAFGYPAATGTYYCPHCQYDRYAAAWKRLTDRIGAPPDALLAQRGEGL